MLTNFEYSKDTDPKTGLDDTPAKGTCVCGIRLELFNHLTHCACGRTYDKAGSEMI